MEIVRYSIIEKVLNSSSNLYLEIRYRCQQRVKRAKFRSPGPLILRERTINGDRPMMPNYHDYVRAALNQRIRKVGPYETASSGYQDSLADLSGYIVFFCAIFCLALLCEKSYVLDLPFLAGKPAALLAVENDEILAVQDYF
jgi:hypothetical protein